MRNGHKQIKTIRDLEPDSRNANKGTPRGLQMVEDSLRTYGAGRSILADKNGRIIAGNKTLKSASDIDLPIRVVETDGKELVVVQRTDLDLKDKKARELGIADNRSSQVGLEWDADILSQLKDEGVELSGMFTEKELAALLPQGGELDAYSQKIDAPIYEPKNEKPDIACLFDGARTNELISEIVAADDISEAEKGFLVKAAHRHRVFNFERIADYYAHSNSKMQDLMEKSALVIIDFDKAIEHGYVELADGIAELYTKEHLASA